MHVHFESKAKIIWNRTVDKNLVVVLIADLRKSNNHFPAELQTTSARIENVLNNL